MIAIGSDHGGYKLKEEIKRYLEEKEIVAYNFHSAQLLTSSVIDTDFVEIE